jgi:hypothetical protein
MTSHRTQPRPRYGRITALGVAVLVTLVSALAGLGVLSTSPTAVADQAARPASYDRTPSSGTTPSTGTTPTTPSTSGGTHSGTRSTDPTTSGGRTDAPVQVAVPDASGTGRRIVFSQHLQRVWLVGGHDRAQRTYLVSGSLTDNLQPGTYAVYSRSRHATGISDSGAMEFFARFTQGPTGAAIGFHSIPTKNGHALQTVAQLGTPQSHGCIRQWRPDAIALWHFAPIGTKVVVVA